VILKLDHIYKDYIQGKMTVPVLKDVSLHVEQGEYVAIMGPSGSGKSTLMNIVGCLDRPTSGEYELAGKNILKLNDKLLADVRLNSIGFVFQNFQLLPRMSALDNVALPLIYAGVRKKVRREKAREALIRVGLEERVSFTPSQLSGGQKQRAAVARAIITNPKLLLADEPTGALDSRSTDSMLKIFSDINSEGQTILMVTHSTKAASHAGRVLFIKDGEVFHQIYRGNSTNEEMYQKISDTLTLISTGGDKNE